MTRYKVGDKFNLSKDALDNYRVGPGPYTVRAVYTHYCKPADMQRDPSGHPGFDTNGGSPLYGSIELPFDVYEWEMQRAPIGAQLTQTEGESEIEEARR